MSHVERQWKRNRDKLQHIEVNNITYWVSDGDAIIYTLSSVEFGIDIEELKLVNIFNATWEHVFMYMDCHVRLFCRHFGSGIFSDLIKFVISNFWQFDASSPVLAASNISPIYFNFVLAMENDLGSHLTFWDCQEKN